MDGIHFEMVVCHKLIKAFKFKISRWLPSFVGLTNTVEIKSPSQGLDCFITPLLSSLAMSRFMISLSPDENSEISIRNSKAAKLISRAKSTDYAHGPSYLMGSLCSDDEIGLTHLFKKLYS